MIDAVLGVIMYCWTFQCYMDECCMVDILVEREVSCEERREDLREWVQVGVE